MTRYLVPALLALLWAPCAFAATHAVVVPSASAGCPQFFARGYAPALDTLQAKPVIDLCFPAYALEESTAWRMPVWSAEHLVAANLPPAGTVRKDAFHAEDALTPDERSELADYKACNKIDDKGHATPVGDFRDPSQRDDTFTLANMMSQVKVNNEQQWSHIEGGVRAAVRQYGEAWVVTGPQVPTGGATLCGRVPQAAAIWKAIYIPSTGVIGAYWAPNDASKAWTTIAVAELTKRTGIDPFPALAADLKAQTHDLPKPVAGGAP
jgi:endonuclease G